MRPIICDCCQIRIDDSWNGPAIEVKVHNGVDSDVSGDYCVDCAGSVADADRISHGTPSSHIETHVSRTSREQAVEDLREAEELTKDSEAERCGSCEAQEMIANAN